MNHSETLVLLCVLIFSSALIQSVSGFGYALFSAPILAASLGGAAAVSTILITGTACDLAILGMRRRVPRPAAGEVLRLAVWSAPGLLAGAWLLSVLPQRSLQALVAVTVILGVGFRAVSRRVGSAAVRSFWGAPSGFMSGTLSTSTSLGAPPVVMYLSHRNLPAITMRDTLVALSVARLPLSVAALAVTGVWHAYSSWPLLIVMALAGQGLGSILFHRYAAARYEAVVMLLLVTSGFTALAMAIQ